MKRSTNGEATTGDGAGGLNAFLDQGSAFEGKLTFSGVVRIDGSFTGDILSDDVLHVGETGQLSGTIQVGEAVISGHVRGNLQVKGQVEFRPTAVFDGELSTGSLVVAAGAKLDGQIRMSQGQEAPKKAPKELEDAVANTLSGGAQ